MSETGDSDLNVILARIHNEILPLLDAAITDDSVVFANPHLTACWKAKNCTHARCPVLNNETDLRSWHIAGTYCGGKAQGVFAAKFRNCKLCEVYRAGCPTIVEELGEGINNYLYLIRKQKAHNAKQLHQISHLNKELASAIENLDTKNREIQELVVSDKLTGLFNRGYLFTVLEDEVTRCQSAAAQDWRIPGGGGIMSQQGVFDERIKSTRSDPSVGRFSTVESVWR